MVVFHDSTHYPNDGGLSANSISDDSAIAGSSQPFSPGTLDEDHTPYSSELQVSLADHVLTSITESINEYGPEDDDEHELEGRGSDHHGSQDMHLMTGASQDNELITGTWHGTSQHSSSHSQDPHSQDPHSNPDSGYIPGPTRSQESFPLKSQESFGPKSQEVYPSDLGYGVSNSNGSPPGGAGGHGNLTVPRSNLKKDDHKTVFGSPSTPQKTMGGTPTRAPHLHPLGLSSNYPPMSRGKGMDIPYSNRPGGYATLPHGFHHHDPKQRSPGGMDDSPYDNGPRMAHMEWRRAYHGGDFPYHHHEMPMYGSLPPGGMMHPDPFYRGSGRFSRPPEALMGQYPPKQKDGRIQRTMSHERVDQPPSFMMGPAGHHFNHEDYSGPMEYHLSQPSPFYDRPGGMFSMPPAGAGAPHPHMMG